jgi:hypothetical protein
MYELHSYSVPELAKFKKRELVADAEYLDGEPAFRLHITTKVETN